MDKLVYILVPQDTADTDTNPELQDLEGKGFPTHLAAKDAIKQTQQHNGYQIDKIASNLQPAKPMYQKFCCFRRDDLTSGGVKIDDPCFWTIRVDFVDGSWVVQRPDGTHSHDAVDYTTPKPNWRCDVCEQDFDWNEKDSHICPGPTGTCYKCCVRFPKSEFAAHRLTCPSLVCGTCRKRKVEDMEQHRKECPGPPKKHRKQCTKCRQFIDKNKFEEHLKACEYWYCRHCLMAIVASERDEHQKICEDWQCAICCQRMKASQRDEHLPNCPLWRCTHCIRKFPRLAKDEHVQSCEFWLSKLCLTVVLKTERDAHLQKCARWCCGRCQTIMSKSERDQHLQTCEYWRCSRCSKRYLASMRDKHKIACAEALPARCIHCRKPGLHDKISKHEAECEARVCPGCAYTLRVDTIAAHWAKCTKMKCLSCSRIVERNEPHDCQKQRCSICLRRFPRGCENDHLRHCEGFKKIDSLCSKEESDRAIRSFLSQGFRFPLLEGCARTLTTFLKHPRNTFIVDFECIRSEDGPLPLKVAIFDAAERQVVSATVIDHGMTIGELRKKISLSKFYQARGPFCSVAVIQKFQPGRDEDRTTGMTCHAIADLIRKHVDVSAIFTSVSPLMYARR